MSAPSAPERDAAAWRGVLTALPARDLLRLLQADKAIARTVLAGFRPGGEALRNPSVQTRLVEAALRNPAFAASLDEAHAALREAPERAPKSPAAPPPVAAEPHAPDPKVKDKLKELRAAVREKDARLADLEAQVAALTRERDQMRADADAQRKARKDAEALVERERRQRERDARRVAPRPVEGPAPRPEPAPRAEATSAPAAVRTVSPALEEALRRLVNRGRYAAVADLCRELHASDAPADASDRGAVHALMASALYGQGQDAAGEEQDRLAASAFLDAGRVSPAADAVARALAHRALGPVRAVEINLLNRLLTLAGRTGETESVQATLARLRVTAPAAYQRLLLALRAAGRKHAALLASLTPSESAQRVGADDRVALPTPGRTASVVTPRELVAAVERGDENLVTCARDGIETLRRTEASRADALLEAVVALAPAAVHPLLHPLVRPVVVDASNVARYANDPLARVVDAPSPVSVSHLTAMRDHLLKRGFFPVLLIADANLRYLIDDRVAYQALVERGAVQESAPGVPADASLIAEARERVAPLVTNDRLAEWGDVARRVERIAFDIFPGGAVALMPV